ncbi:MAG: MFS transporter [Halioglobus sp.]
METLKRWLPALSAMCFLGLGPGLVGIYGFFVDPLSREFGVGAAVINIGPVAILLVPSLISPFIGRLTDRVPIRRLILVGVSVAMGALLAISQAPSLTLAMLGFLVFAAGMAGYGPVVVNSLMVKLYLGREARALALAAIGISLAGVVLPPTVGVLLAHFDWRAALAMLAVGVFVLLWLVALTGIPAGIAGVSGVAVAPPPPEAAGLRRAPAFWLIGFAMALGLNAIVVLSVCYPLHFAVRGFSVAEAGWFIALSGVTGLCGKLLLAGFGDALRPHAKWLAAACLCGQLAGLALLLNGQTYIEVVLAMGVMGFSSGAFLPMHPYLNSRYFDAAVIGRVTGAQMPLFLPFGIIGAPLAGFVYDRNGHHDVTLMALMLVLALAALLLVCLPRAAAARD